MKDKIWVRITLIGLLAVLVMLSGITVFVDPFFHYHKPLHMFYYILDQEYYTNDGIARQFEYDAVITGTSMSQNFKASQFDELYGVKSIKTAYSGSPLKKIHDFLMRAFQYNSEIKMVLQSLDGNYLLASSNEDFTMYLNDDNIFNDVYYIMNKDVLLLKTLTTLRTVRTGGGMTSLDDYTAWYLFFEAGKEEVLAGYQRPEAKEYEPVITLAELDDALTAEEKARLTANLQKNVIDLVEKYPDTTYLFFFPPYSIVAWDELRQKGEVAKRIAAERIFIEALVQYDNVELYSFSNNYDLTTDLDYYKDPIHYTEVVSEEILVWMHQGDYRLTQENYMLYLEGYLNFYLTYAYEEIFR